MPVSTMCQSDDSIHSTDRQQMTNPFLQHQSASSTHQLLRHDEGSDNDDSTTKWCCVSPSAILSHLELSAGFQASAEQNVGKEVFLPRGGMAVATD